MPRVRMSSDFRMQQSHFRFGVQEPQSCRGAQEKINNLRRELTAIKKLKEEALAVQDRLEFLNKSLLVAGLIKETCYSFLDLAVSLGSDILPEPLGKKVGIVGNAGMASMEMSETLMEYSLGQSTGGDVLRTSAGALNKALPANSNIDKALQYSTDQNLQMFEVMDVSRKGDTEKTRQAVQTASTNMSLDAVIFQLDTMPENTQGVKYLKSGVSTVKAAKRYNDALETTFDSYLEEKEGISESRFALKQRMRGMVEAAHEKLEKALSEFSHCMVQ